MQPSTPTSTFRNLPTRPPPLARHEPLAARADVGSHGPSAPFALTFAAAREVAFGAGPGAGAIVGVYGSGKSTLLFELLHEAVRSGVAVVWEEAAALVATLLPSDEPVLPQVFAARTLAWVQAVCGPGAVRDRYLQGLGDRGRDDVVEALGGAAPARAGAAPVSDGRVLLLLDEVEQAHQLLLRRVASDDGQPLRALIDACGPRLRLLLAYAPESYHSLGDADRGRLVRLGLPALDVATIQATWGLGRGAANFAWWVSRGRARGVVQAVRGVLVPAAAGAFDADLHALGDALDALPGVFGVPALLRDGLDHARLGALLDLKPQPARLDAVGGITCSLADRRALADTARRELERRLGPHSALAAVANELVAILEACAGDDLRCYLTLADFSAALRLAEARSIEAGRVAEPLAGLAEQGARIFDAMGTLGPLSHALPVPLAELADQRFPSPFTDPFLPLPDGSAWTAVELQRSFAPLAAGRGPVLVDDEGGFAVFADADQLAAYLYEALADAGAEPLRALLLDDAGPLAPVVELAVAAGRLAFAPVGRFHATLLRCLALRGLAAGSLRWADAAAGFAADRQLQRKLAWHRDRVLVVVRELHPRVEPAFAVAAAFLRQYEPFRATLARLDRDSPALLGLLVPLRPPAARERAVALRVVALLGEGSPLRRLAREANPGGRLSGAAVVIDSLLPGHGRQPRWSDSPPPAAAQLAAVLQRFGASPALQPLLAGLLFADDRARLAAVIRAFAGELPDVHRERDALAALRRLDETAQRAAAIVADLQRCTGRGEAGLGALRIGSFVDQVRQHDGPVDALRRLAADVDALPAQGAGAWLRALAQWLVGVIAARLLKGVERDQVALAEWQRVAASGADLGRRADQVVERAVAIGAERVVELMRHRRACFANQLDDARAASHALAEVDTWVGALEPLVDELDAAQVALQDRGVSLAQALAGYLPELDAIAGHRALLRRLPEQLEELGPQLPRPGAEGLVAWLVQLRQRAEASRRDRARMALEDELGLALPAQFVAVPDDLPEVQAAWARVDPAALPALRALLTSAALTEGAQLARAIEAWVEKCGLFAAWGDPGHPALVALDARAVARCEVHGVGLDEVQAISRARSRSLAAVRDLQCSLPARAAPDAVEVDPTQADVAAAWHSVGERARSLYEQLTAARERHARLVGAYPTACEDADDVRTVVAAIDADLARQQAAYDEAMVALRRVGAALLEHGEAPASPPPDATLVLVHRLLERDQRRLCDVVERRRARLVEELRRHGLPVALAPAAHDDVLAAHHAVVAGGGRLVALEPTLAAAHALGLRPDGADVAVGWDGVAAALAAQVEAGRQELLALRQRHGRLARRRRRLGDPVTDEPPLATSLAQARERVLASERVLEDLRASRLAGASAAARAVYDAVAHGRPDALAAPIAELVALGLLCTAEAEA